MSYRRIKQALSSLPGLSLLMVIAGCGNGPNQPPPPKKLAAIEVAPTNSTIAVGATLQFSATGKYDDGSTGDVTGAVQWASSDATLASISSGGKATGTGIGRPKITASSGSISATATLIIVSGHVSSVPRFAYATDLIDNTISIYTVNAGTGQLRHNGYTLVNGNPVAVAIGPTGKFAYTADSATNSISAYSINTSTGALGKVAGSPLPTGNGPNSVAVDPSGVFVYTANQAGDVSGFAINPTTGGLTAVSGSPFSAGTQPVAVRVHPSGQFLYVANAASSNISAYRIDAVTGALSQIPGSPFPTGMQPFGLEVDATGRLIYVANEISKSVTAFAIDQNSGTLTEVPGSPFPAGDSPNSLTIDPSSKYVYVTNTDAGTVSAFSIGATGALTAIAGSPFSTGTMPNCVKVDPSGKFAYVVNLSTLSESVTVFSVNATTGALTFVGESRTRGQATSLAVLGGSAAVAYAPKFLYATNLGSNNLSSYAVDPTTGSLSTLPTGPTATGQNPFGVTTDPTGKFVYVSNGFNSTTNQYEKSISGFVAAGDGSLTPISGSPFPAGRGTTGMAVDPSGRFLYAANYYDFTLSAYAIDPATGVLTELAGSPYLTGREPVTVAIDPTGQFLYIGNQNNTCDNPLSTSCPISAFRINANDGSLTATPGPSTGGIEPSGIAVDPTGKYLYLANQSEAVISQFSITPVDGTLSFIGMTTPPQTSAAVSVAVDPSSKFLITDIGQFTLGQTVDSFQIDSLTGMLPTNPTMTLPTAGFDFFYLTIDPSGKYIYVADQGNYPSVAGKIWGFELNAATGELRLIRNTPWAAGTGTASVAATGEIQ